MLAFLWFHAEWGFYEKIEGKSHLKCARALLVKASFHKDWLKISHGASSGLNCSRKVRAQKVFIFSLSRFFCAFNKAQNLKHKLTLLRKIQNSKAFLSVHKIISNLFCFSIFPAQLESLSTPHYPATRVRSEEVKTHGNLTEQPSWKEWFETHRLRPCLKKLF